jgi:hypothetical protein
MEPLLIERHFANLELQPSRLGGRIHKVMVITITHSRFSNSSLALSRGILGFDAIAGIVVCSFAEHVHVNEGGQAVIGNLKTR